MIADENRRFLRPADQELTSPVASQVPADTDVQPPAGQSSRQLMVVPSVQRVSRMTVPTVPSCG